MIAVPNEVRRGYIRSFILPLTFAELCIEYLCAKEMGDEFRAKVIAEFVGECLEEGE